MSSIITNYGPIKGIEKTTADGKAYSAYFGIPYAKQPVGELRFRDPEPLEPWTEELDASKENDGAYQVNAYSLLSRNKDPIIGSDECLVLNVFKPKTDEKTLPVFVYIHGGGFICGSSSTYIYGPDYLVEKDMIVVTINYRLGVVGFLSFKDPSLQIPGNAGLKDQSMALRWVKENIASFGGDPDSITVGGESAGGASAHFQCISPMSEGLFNRAIIQSGTAFNSWANFSDDEHYEYELARALGWNGEGGDLKAYETIAQTEISKLLYTAISLISDQERKLFGSAYFGPCLPRVEPYQGKQCFLPKPIVELSREAWSNKIDVIIGK